MLLHRLSPICVSRSCLLYTSRKVEVHFVNSEKLTDENVCEALKGMAGVMIGPGFGQRAVSYTHLIAIFNYLLLKDHMKNTLGNYVLYQK